MKLFLNTILILLTSLARPLAVFANGDGDHPPGTPHTEAASIDTTIVIGIVIFLLIAGFIVWKFVLRNPPSSVSTQPKSQEEAAPVQEKSVSDTQNDASKNPS